jgi:transcriptional regulator with XRE-family HTH domain
VRAAVPHRPAESRCDWRKLHALRGDRTLAELAAVCGISSSALEYAEAHDSGLSASMLDRLAAALNLPAAELQANPEAMQMELISSLGLGSSLRAVADDRGSFLDDL